MAVASSMLKEDYWEHFTILKEDAEFIYNNLLELESPLTSTELVSALVRDRILREKSAIEKSRTSGGDLYQPKGNYAIDQTIIFPALNWQRGSVSGVRNGFNPDLGKFDVISVNLENGEKREFAANLNEHSLNAPPQIAADDPQLNPDAVLKEYSGLITKCLEEDLITNPDFVRIAGKWFPRALLVEINIGHLNIAEAVLDMKGGGPSPTSDILDQLELGANINRNLLEFSLDLALQEDTRFDEVGPAGDVLWFLNRLEPKEVLETPLFLRYDELDYDRNVLTPEMLELERELDDELSDIQIKPELREEVEVSLIFPHLNAGTLPLSRRIRHLFPTAYEAPRIRFELVDGNSKEKFPAWVVREKGYVFGLKDWYESNDLIPGSIIRVKRGKTAGEVIIQTGSRRSSREWIKTVLVGSDGGIVFAMLKQLISGTIDDRMGIAIPDPSALDDIWVNTRKSHTPFEQIVVNNVKELAKLNPQNHVHASELYAAVNITRRCPPGPLLALLASRPWFIHVGDLHYRLSEQDI